MMVLQVAKSAYISHEVLKREEKHAKRLGCSGEVSFSSVEWGMIQLPFPRVANEEGSPHIREYIE